MGMYPLNPASGNYDFGSPLMSKSTIDVGGGKIFTTLAPKVSDKNIYIQSIKLNGKPYQKLYITHADMVKGGTLEFEMGSKPNQKLSSYEVPK
ncbi:MAG: glycoside hydrolase domain-containing protein, partial [Chitinophagaceae bacterium]